MIGVDRKILKGAGTSRIKGDNLQSNTSYVLFMGTYPPRECGIATFTFDLVKNFQKSSNSSKAKVLAMNRNGINTYNYPKEVIYQLNDSDIDGYINLAKKINEDDKIRLVCIQHEFGIFGGVNGSYLIAFLEILTKPVVVTFHSIIPSPDNQIKKDVQAISDKVDEVVVMCETGKKILVDDYEIKNEIIRVIPHGIPEVDLGNEQLMKRKLNLDDKRVISSFGMISCDKGYEYVIRSLPGLVKKYPNLLYLIVGETHPLVRKNDGESYRNFLEKEVKRLGLHKHVKFYNKYVSLKEIIMYIKASDVYISSGLNPNQITSGTLSYAMGCGKPVISTPFLHAKEVLTQDKGILTKFKDSDSFANALDTLLGDEKKRNFMASNTYQASREMVWRNVASKYRDVFNVHTDNDSEIMAIPNIRLNHLRRMTDNFGIVQFAKNTKPDLDTGYSLDDVARALVVCSMYNKINPKKNSHLIKTYLEFMNYVQDDEGKFYNLVDKEKNIDKKSWSEDAHCRAVWSLGHLISQGGLDEYKIKAINMFEKASIINKNINSPRSICFLIIGYHMYNKVYSSPRNMELIQLFADKLVGLYREHSSQDWKWFENYLTYDNSKLPEALFYAYLNTGDKKFLDVALESFEFLNSICFENDMFSPIGQRGWYSKGGKRAHFDQQPIEAASFVQTLLVAYNITNNKSYLDKAFSAFNWFLGKNRIGQVLYAETSGGCYDGLGERTVNINQGAESTVSYLTARLLINDFINVDQRVK